MLFRSTVYPYHEGPPRLEDVADDCEGSKDELSLDVFVHVMESSHVRCPVRDDDVSVAPFKMCNHLPSRFFARDVSLQPLSLSENSTGDLF